VHPVSTESEHAPDARIAALERLVAIVDRLRAPGGCPWDRKQTLATMAPCLIEEAH
jgi:XTP/dITP diphosphohydrolase